MIEIYLVRHAQSEANTKHIFGGDYPLSFKGQSQVVAAREFYRQIPFDKVYSSKLRRAKETATQLFVKPVPEERQLSEFNEIWFGDVEDMPDTKKGVKGYKCQYHDDFVGFMEECNGDDPYKRAKVAIDKLKSMADEIASSPSEYPNKRIMIVTSDTLMRCIALTTKKGEDWRKITDLPRIGNLDALRLTYSGNLDTGNMLQEISLYLCEKDNR